MEEVPSYITQKQRSSFFELYVKLDLSNVSKHPYTQF